MKLQRVRLSRPLGRVERELNKVVEAVNGNRLAQAPGYRLHRTSDGTKLEVEVPEVEPGEPGSSVQQYKVTAIADDYIEAKTWDGTNLGATAVKIAKPWRLRKTGWHGVAVTYNFNGTNFVISYSYLSTPGYRTATRTAPAATENQAIIPIYSVNDIIYATEPEGGTLVSVSGTALTWLDLNVDAREWARY